MGRGEFAVYLSLLDLMRQSGALMDELLRESGALLSQFSVGAPAIDLASEGDRLVLRAQLPGIDPKSVQIQVTESSVAIGGHGSREEKTEGPSFVHMSAGVRQFFQEVPLPARIDPHRASATWEQDGTLVITLPTR